MKHSIFLTKIKKGTFSVPSIKEGKNFDMLVLPGNSHGFSGAAEEFFERKLWFHFATYLLGDSSADFQGDINYFQKR